MYQLRIYVIEEGRMDDFVAAFPLIAQARRAHGFEVIGPWIEVESGRFVWIAGHEGDFDDATRRYYESPQRSAIQPDPAQWVVESDIRMMRPAG